MWSDAAIVFDYQLKNGFSQGNTRTLSCDNVCKDVGISKDVSVHNLRHSFATHLLESGIDLRYMLGLFGHKSSKTTEIYTLVSNKDLSRILSPLDLILKKEARID